MSWKVEVQTGGDDWATNAVALATKEEAEWAAKDLMRRWMLVTAWRAVESDEPVNYEVIDNKLRPVQHATA